MRHLPLTDLTISRGVDDTPAQGERCMRAPGGTREEPRSRPLGVVETLLDIVMGFRFIGQFSLRFWTGHTEDATTQRERCLRAPGETREEPRSRPLSIAEICLADVVGRRSSPYSSAIPPVTVHIAFFRPSTSLPFAVLSLPPSLRPSSFPPFLASFNPSPLSPYLVHPYLPRMIRHALSGPRSGQDVI